MYDEQGNRIICIIRLLDDCLQEYTKAIPLGGNSSNMLSSEKVDIGDENP